MFDPKLAIGQVLTEKEVHDLFECQTTLGIRMSKKNNLFVIMSGTGSRRRIYNDKWDGDTLLYNGTDINADATGDQTLRRGRGNNNSQLYHVWDTPEDAKPQIFLFVKRQSNRCVFKGEVTLSQKPYQITRHDDQTKKVWIFPLKLKSVDSQNNAQAFQEAETNALGMQLDELYKKVKGKAEDRQPQGTQKKHSSQTTVYDRDPDISAYVKLRANGVCDLCSQNAPFKDKDDHPYLESHHIVWLSKNGADEIDNVVALCPNCHKKMHIINSRQDVEKLKKKIEHYKGINR